MKIKCDVIEDLLPLYIDEICSNESKIIIEEHLKECKLCNNKFMIQKGELIVDDDDIKENLKSKEPFKKIWKSQMISLIAMLFIIPLLYLSIVEFGGDGVGFSALFGRYKTEKFLSCIEKGRFDDAARYMIFPGGRYGAFKSEEQAKGEWVKGMQELKNQGIEIISHRRNDIKTDDSFTSGDVIVSVSYDDKTYDFTLFISTNNRKIEPGNLVYAINNSYQEPTEVERMLMERISKVISTYNPG